MDAFFIAFFDFKFPIGPVKKVVNAIQVKLHEADSDCELSLVQLFSDGGEDVIDC